MVFHAGTALAPTARIVTAGGRVLTVVGHGPTRSKPRSSGRTTAVREIAFDGMQYRSDIGRKAVDNAKADARIAKS